VLASVSFLISAYFEPGYLSKEYDYINLVEEIIEGERDLWNLCTYCELVKSSTSFHCLYCKRCIDLFDHHCPYINNCLGGKNTKFFLVFVVSYFAYLLSAFAETIRFLYDSLTDQDSRQVDIIDVNIAIILIVLIGLNLPLAAY
jgi:DHHC palmitoyltransferase